MTGSGDNTLKLNLDDLLDASTSTNILKVLGNSGDEVIATGFDDSTIDKTVIALRIGECPSNPPFLKK
jgi:hypothetical protein